MNRPELEAGTPRTLSEYSNYLTIGPHSKPVTSFPCFNRWQYPLFWSAVHIRERPFNFYGGGGRAARLYWAWIFFHLRRDPAFLFAIK